MKKFSALFLILVLMLSIVGCNTPSSDDKEGKIIEAYCYVVHVKSNGFVASINDVGYVYIKCSNAKKQIETFDTVIIEYYETDLIEKSGTYTDGSGERASYSYKITDPKAVRVADPSKGEPVLG